MKPLNILFIEEHKEYVHDIVRQLNQADFDINYYVVSLPRELQRHLEDQQTDFVIADFEHGRMDPFDSLKRVRANAPNLPFIFIADELNRTEVINATQAGANDFIARCDIARLVPIIIREQRDAEERHARLVAEEQLLYHANHDSLTGLINRQEFELKLEKALSEVRHEQHDHALMYLDLDQFKVVNDTCGHIAGDELLRQLVDILKDSIREVDILARLGGDEFGILLQHCNPDQALRLATQLTDRIRGFRYSWIDKTFEPSASIGVVNIDTHQQSVTQLLSNADLACYAAKESGRNRIHVFNDSSDTARHSGDMHWVSDLTQALDSDRFRLFYQEIKSLKPGRHQHAEILIRMLDENDKLVPPGVFVPAAERYNLMPAIDRWVIGKLFGNIHRLHSNQPDADHRVYSINISGNSLNDPMLLDFIKTRTTDTHIVPQYTCFEITETSAISNINQAVHFIRELKALGYLFSLDDFGSGLSSFTYLKNLPVDYLKIDGSFVHNIVNDPIDRAMVEAINKVGQVMGLQTIGEFVEDEFVEEELKILQVDWAQGFGIHKPELLQGVEYL